MKPSLLLGALFGLFSAVSLTAMNVFVKLIGSQVPVFEIIWCRFFLGLILLLPVLWAFRKTLSLRLEKPWRFLGRTLCALLALALLFMAVQKMSLAQALLLANTSPLMVPILAFLMMRSKMTWMGVLGIVLGFIGVGVVLNPEHAHMGWGSLLALGAAFFASLAILQIRLLGKTMAATPMLFYYFLMSTVLMTPFTSLHVVIPETTTLWLFLAAVGIAGFAYQWCSTLSYQLAPVRLTTPILYVNVLLGGLVEWVLWHQKPSLNFLIGCVIIIAGVMITLLLGKPAETK